MAGTNGHKPGASIVIHAPAAVAQGPMVPPTPEEIIQFQAARIQELEREKQAMVVNASTIANATINLLDRLCELGYGSRDGGVTSEKETWEKSRGLQLTVQGDEKTGKVVVRAREKEKPAPIAYEDRQD